jgi:hypothetical protein
MTRGTIQRSPSVSPAFILAAYLAGPLLLAACLPAGAPDGGTHGLSVSISPKGGAFAAPVAVSLASDPAGAEIRFTTDGSAPGASTGSAYSGPFSVAASSTVKAWARLASTGETATAEASFSIDASAPASLVPESLWGRWSCVPLVSVPASGLLASFVPAFRVDGAGVDVQIRRRSDGLVYAGRDTAPTASSDGGSLEVEVVLSSQGRSPLSYGFALSLDRSTGELGGRVSSPVDEYRESFSVYRSDPRPVGATGRLLLASSSPAGSRALVAAGNINLIIRNAITHAEHARVSTDGSGAFAADGLLVGTGYVATGFEGAPPGVVTDSIPFTVTMDGQDAGVFTLKDAGENYRIGLSQPDIFDAAEVAASSYLLAGQGGATSFAWFVKNIGTATGSGLSLSLSPDAGIELVEGGSPAFDAPLPAGVYRSFSMSLRHPGAIAGIMEEKGVAVTVTNTGSGESWTDTLPVRVFRDALEVGVPAWNLVPSENLVAVSASLPSGKTFYMDSAERTPVPFIDGTVVCVSLATGEDSYSTGYQLMANASGGDVPYLPAIYNRGDGGAASAHEPNDSVAAAEAIEPGEIILSGLAMDQNNRIDLDYYILRRPATEAPAASYSLAALAGGGTAPALSAPSKDTYGKEPIASAYDPVAGIVHGIFANDGSRLSYSKGILGDPWDYAAEDPPLSLMTAARAFVGMAVEGATLHAVFVTEAKDRIRYAAKANGGPWQAEEEIGTPSGMGYADNYRLECRISGGYLYALAGRSLCRRDLAAAAGAPAAWLVTAFADPIDQAADDYYAAKEGRLLPLSDGSVFAAQHWSHSKPAGAIDRYIVLAKVDGSGTIASRDQYSVFYAPPYERHFALESDPQDELKALLSLPGKIHSSLNTALRGYHVARVWTNNTASSPYSVYSTSPPNDTRGGIPGNYWTSLFPLVDGRDSSTLLYSTTNGLFAFRKRNASTWRVQEVSGPGGIRYTESNIVDLLDHGRGWALFKTLDQPLGGTGTFKFLFVRLP